MHWVCWGDLVFGPDDVSRTVSDEVGASRPDAEKDSTQHQACQSKPMHGGRVKHQTHCAKEEQAKAAEESEKEVRPFIWVYNAWTGRAKDKLCAVPPPPQKKQPITPAADPAAKAGLRPNRCMSQAMPDAENMLPTCQRGPSRTHPIRTNVSFSGLWLRSC
jgi:hypothetical protein